MMEGAEAQGRLAVCEGIIPFFEDDYTTIVISDKNIYILAPPQFTNDPF